MERVGKGRRSAIVHRRADERARVASALAYAVSAEPEHSSARHQYVEQERSRRAARQEYEFSVGEFLN
jgi:hypothetical protein